MEFISVGYESKKYLINRFILKELLDTKRWEITEKQSATQPSFIRNDLINGEITNDVWWEN